MRDRRPYSDKHRGENESVLRAQCRILDLIRIIFKILINHLKYLKHRIDALDNESSPFHMRRSLSLIPMVVAFIWALASTIPNRALR
ncbi:unnamed protein product [Camellia sinensis]